MTRTPRTRTVLVHAAVATACTAGGLTIAPVTHAAACPDVEVAFARGTGEAPGLGITGRPFVRALTAALPDRTVSSYAVDYAANASQTSAGPGATDLTQHLVDVAATCPGTRFVLGGYSQGATVVDIAIGLRAGSTRGAAIPPGLSERVAAVVVFGNPLGMAGRTIAGSSPVYGPKAKEFCATGDPVCGGGGSMAAHLGYATDGSTTQGARFAADLITGRTGPAGTPRPTPTAPSPTGTAPPVPDCTPRPTRLGRLFPWLSTWFSPRQAVC